MNIYKLDADADNFESANVADESDYDRLSCFDGTRIQAWNSLQLCSDEEDFGVKPKGDCPSLISFVPIFSQFAVNALRHVLVVNGQLLPVTIDGEEYFAFNVTNMLDALDVERSEGARFSSGRLFHITRHVFNIEHIPDETCIFKVRANPTIGVFVTDKFIDMVNAANLKGFKFEKVWSSENRGN
jgi:hypothetical protein